MKTMLARYRGEWLTLTSFLIWGLLPLYFQQLAEHSASTILAARVLLSVPVLAIVFFLVRKNLKRPSCSQAGWALLGAALISTSWFGNLWGTLNGQLLAVSLAFFLSPILTIVAGMLFFNERLSVQQWLSFVICVVAFVFYCIANGELPWLTLMIAFAFALFSVVKRKGQVSELAGLGAEVVLMLPVALFILWGTTPTIGFSWSSDLWLLCIVPIYYLPLALYGMGVRSVRQITTAGLMTYIEPVIMYVLALTVFQEEISPLKQIAMYLVWLGVLVSFPFKKIRLGRRSHTYESGH
ncbi:EamA family transporter [Spongorhabdus nitratireducens]